MPARTNDFQKLIFLIEQQLAPHGAVVRESVLLTDHRTGDGREIDIMIEIQSGVHPFKMAIECIGHSRPAPVTWIEQIQQKHADIPIHKTILVSRSGFSRAARLKATALDMEAISLREALSADWAVIPNRKGALNLIISVRSPINVKMNFVPPLPDGLHVSQLTLHAPSGEALPDSRTVLLNTFFQDPEVQAAEETVVSGTSKIVQGELVFPSGTYGTDGDGNRYELRSWKVEATISKDNSHVSLQNASYSASACVAYGTVRQFGLKADVLFLERQGEGLTFTLSFRKPT